MKIDMKQIKCGIAGYGKMGRIREASIAASEDTRLVSLYEVTDHEHHDQSVKLCSSYQELLETNVDAIIVSAYVKVAAEYVIQALEAVQNTTTDYKPPVFRM